VRYDSGYRSPISDHRSGSEYRSPISGFPTRSLSEADLSRLWQGQLFPAEALTTRDGMRLRVVYRGRLAGGPGPDFRDAIIAAPGTLLQGDVELHVRSSDFRRHGHDRDPAYGSIVLHVVFHDDDGADTPLPGGRRAPVVVLGDWVEGRAREIRRWLERPTQWREPCFSAVSRLGTGDVLAALDRLGDMRFRQKAAAFAKRLRCEDPEELLWEALLEALGYGGRREAFRQLARRLPWARLRSDLMSRAAKERASLARGLLRASYDADSTSANGRPGNRPERRLDGAAQLAARFAPRGLLASLAPLLARPPEGALKALTGRFSVPELIGPSRAREMVANAVLPLLAAIGPEASARDGEPLYRLLPLPARYGAVRHLHEAVAGEVRVNARRQQGMLYLLKQYCTQGGCGRCPLS
jgi:hypothetical protein